MPLCVFKKEVFCFCHLVVIFLVTKPLATAELGHLSGAGGCKSGAEVFRGHYHCFKSLFSQGARHQNRIQWHAPPRVQILAC